MQTAKYYSQLIKFRLSTTVVFSATAGYLLGAAQINIQELFLLIIGGFLVTGSANGFNQVLEQDYDKLMNRTANRPLPKKNITANSAALFSVIIGLIGFYLLSMIKPHGSFYGYLSKSSVFGLLSLLIYVLSYTPLKRMSTASIFIGAIPGAIPIMLGWIAATDDFGLAVGILFAIQFLWQFPHFISISWIRDNEYKKAGFKMMYGGKKGKYPALIATFFAIFMTVVSTLPFFINLGNLKLSFFSCSLIFLLGCWFTYNCYKLFSKVDTFCAKKLMFASLIYLPLSQIIYVLDKWLFRQFF